MSQIYVGLEREPGKAREAAILVGISRIRDESHRSMQELIGLAKTAGAAPVDVLVQNRRKPDLKYFIGSGKVEELKQLVNEQAAEIVLFDAELTAAQVRNLVDEFECKIIDRTELILDIFAGHAHTRIGKLQVELAQLQYLLPRLHGRGEMMDRIAARGGSGGVGVRGPGETKLSTDRRRIRNRITTIKSRLDDLAEDRTVAREKRRESYLPVISLVGYTNAGKSSLLNTLCGSEEVSVDDRLFETLDTTIRNIELGERRRALMVDTVGFIRYLPKMLIEAFKATLEETTEADLLVEVVDGGDRWAVTEHNAVREILQDIDSGDKPMITVLNKWDTIDDPARKAELSADFPHAVPISAKTGYGLDELRERIRVALPSKLVTVTLQIPYTAMEMLDEVDTAGRLIDTEYEAEYVTAQAEIDKATLGRLSEYVVAEA